mmetsp:Transcript_43370/g.102850  ORF Transcript_43370/g.102850 Transcript_43370/m.102850 type:complete len:205 (-) Transcript_43370:585-1199(-)
MRWTSMRLWPISLPARTSMAGLAARRATSHTRGRSSPASPRSISRGGSTSSTATSCAGGSRSGRPPQGASTGGRRSCRTFAIRGGASQRCPSSGACTGSTSPRFSLSSSAAKMTRAVASRTARTTWSTSITPSLGSQAFRLWATRGLRRSTQRLRFPLMSCTGSSITADSTSEASLAPVVLSMLNSQECVGKEMEMQLNERLYA